MDKKVEKKRVIVDYKNITDDLMQLFSDKYADGIEGQTFYFKNAKGERVQAVPLETSDTKYLVKLSAQLVQKVEDFLEEQDDVNDSDDADDAPDTVDVADDFEED